MRRRARVLTDSLVLIGVPLLTLLAVLYWFGWFTSMGEMLEGRP